MSFFSDQQFSDQSWEQLSGVSHEDIARFIQTGYEGASQLYDAGTLYRTRDKTKYYDKRLTTQSGADVTKIYGDFMNWKSQTDQSNMDHEAYMAAKDASPGRDSTVLGFNQEKQGTVLGDTLPYGKTVLG